MAHRRKKSQPSSAEPPDDSKKDKRRQAAGVAGARSTQGAISEILSRGAPIAAAIPVLVALVSSINSLANGFVYDDGDQILNNRMIRSLGNLPMMFTTSVWAFMNNQNIGANDFYYRPVFGCFLTLGYALSGTTAWGWHLMNVAIHAAVAFFVYLVIKEISKRNSLALISATLFAVHPVHAESVAWISGAPDPLMALFVLPSFYFYI